LDADYPARGVNFPRLSTGSGKTKSLTAGVACRIGERNIPADRLLVVTFTNKAAGEMRDRVRAVLGVGAAPSWLGTFHGLGARQLRLEPEIAGLRANFDILDAGDSARIVKRLMVGMRPVEAAAEDEDGRSAAKRVKALCDRLSRFKDSLVTPDRASFHVEAAIARATAGRFWIDAEELRLAARLYVAYQAELQDMNAADFGDLLLWPAITMQSDEAYRLRWSRRFSCVLCDEFQDINRAQFVWLQALARDTGELFAVGDDAQSIYSWRGAEISFIRRFQAEFSGAQIVKLEQNFRSTGHILSAANAVIAHDENGLKKTLFTRRGDGLPIEIVGYGHGKDEAAGIAAEIGRRAAEGTPYEHISILYRANFLSRALEESLLSAHIPYAIVGNAGFYQRVTVKDALALLRLSAFPESRQSDEAFRRVANKPARGLGAKALGSIEVEAGWRDVSLFAAIEVAPLPKAVSTRLMAFATIVREIGQDEDLSLSGRLRALLDRTGYLAMLRERQEDDAETQIENIAELLNLATGFGTVTALLQHAALASAAPGEQTSGRVQLMTLHRAKGLEFPHVFLPAWECGVFPGGGDLDEERRLAYVALTRGMQRVSITWCTFRQGRPVAPSLFIGHIPTEHRVEGWLRYADTRSSSRRSFLQTAREMAALTGY